LHPPYCLFATLEPDDGVLAGHQRT
jgi:hypothetical protein